MLFPLASDIPSSEALVTRVVACKMAILLETLLLVTARNKVDFLVVAHGNRVTYVKAVPNDISRVYIDNVGKL